jgi:hypothetical protein
LEFDERYNKSGYVNLTVKVEKRAGTY